MKRAKTILLVAAISLAWIFGLGPQASSQQTHVVETQDNVFAPVDITIDAGDSVTFDNTGQAPHTATADQVFDTGNINSGESVTITFDEPGTIAFVCIYHEALGMVGEIQVQPVEQKQPSPESKPSPTTPAPDKKEGAQSPSPNPVVQPDLGDVLSSGEVVGGSRRHIGPAIFAALGLLGAMGLAGLSIARERFSK